jgi:hypothetical protein
MSFRRTALALLATSALVGLPACSGGTPTAPGAASAKFPFNVGAKWNYKAVVTANEQSVSGTATLELVKLEGNSASFKLASSFANVGERTTQFNGDVLQNPYSTAEKVGGPVAETITVPAGTFAATKETTRAAIDGGQDTFEFWYNGSHGLLKLVQTSVTAGRITVSTYELQ